MGDLPAWLAQAHQRATNVRDHMRRPSRLGPTAEELRRLPNLPAMTNRTPIQGRQDSAPAPLPTRLPRAQVDLPFFPGQARVGLSNLGEAASDIFGLATQGRSYRRPPAIAEGLVKRAPPIIDLQAPAQITPTDRSSLQDASNPLNGSLADYLNTTMGLRVADAPVPFEPWRQPEDGVVTDHSLAPGSPARVGGFAPPGEAPAPDYAARDNADVRAAIARARAQNAGPDATLLRNAARRELEQLRLRQQLEQRLPRLMAYEDFNRNR